MCHYVGIYQKYSSYASEIQSKWSIIIIVFGGGVGGGGGATEITITIITTTTTTIMALQPSFRLYLIEI
jgi:hypothetical protein